MAGWQAILAAIVSMDIELGEPVHALELFEAVQWHLTRSCDELKQLGLLFLLESTHGTPEPLNLGRSSGVVVVFGVVFPVINIDIRKTRDEQFELLFAEDGYQLGRHDVMETAKELLELFLDSTR